MVYIKLNLPKFKTVYLIGYSSVHVLTINNLNTLLIGLEIKSFAIFVVSRNKPDGIGPVLKPNLTGFRKFYLFIALPKRF